MDTNGRSRSRSSPCASPEFEFWMVRNPSFPQPNILSADQLFVNGVLLPLHLLNNPNPPHHPPDPQPQPQPEQESEPSPAITYSTSAATPSKRWKDIFKKKNAGNSNDTKKKEKKNGVASSAELNINIWPFSRSRSAGNTTTRPKLFAPAARKANSAPCSRSNSAGESKSKKWSSSPGRAGVHLGRSSPVWQVPRAKNSEPPPLHHENKAKSRRSKLGGGSSNPKTKVLNLNVPMCMGYRHQSTCRSEEKSGIGVRGASDNIPGSDSNSGNSNSNPALGVKLFNLRSLFTKKSVVASH